MHKRPIRRAVLALVVLLATTSPASTTSVLEVGDRSEARYQNLAAAGSDLLCGIRADETLECWGRSTISVAGYPEGAFHGVSAARRAACGLRTDASMECWGRWYSDVHQAGRVVAPSGNFLTVDMAEEQGCAIDAEGAVICFGRYVEAASPPAGMRPVEGAFIDVAAMHDDYGGCGIRRDGTIACWGDDRWGQASPPAGTFSDIAAGRMTVCAIRTSGELACWGRGLYGAADPPPGRYTDLAIGGDTGCAIRADDASVSCWGADLGPPPEVPTMSLAIGDTIAGLIGTNGVVHTWGETRLWPSWGGFGLPDRRDGFRTFRIIGDAPARLQQGTRVDLRFTTTPAHPAPRFRLAVGSLPPGLTLTDDGRLAGTPASTGVFGPITLVADNGHAPAASRTLTLTVTAR